MDVHLELGIQKLLDLKPKNLKMPAHDRYGPCIEDDLKLQQGRGCEKWAGGGKTGATYRLWWGSQGDFSEVLCVHKV